jgi:hypothetical protein
MEVRKEVMQEGEMMQKGKETEARGEVQNKGNRTEPDEWYFFVRCLLDW